MHFQGILCAVLPLQLLLFKATLQLFKETLPLRLIFFFQTVVELLQQFLLLACQLSRHFYHYGDILVTIEFSAQILDTLAA